MNGRVVVGSGSSGSGYGLSALTKLCYGGLNGFMGMGFGGIIPSSIPWSLPFKTIYHTYLPNPYLPYLT